MICTRLASACTYVTLVTAALTLRPAPVHAQVIVDPTHAEFSASADHNATTPQGLPLVSSYEIRFFLIGAAQPFQAASLGKPNPNSSNTIRVDLAQAFLGWPLPGTSYVAAVAAVGPGGATASAPSNQFSFSAPPCSYSLSSTALTVGAAGGSGNTNVTTASGCAWMVVSNVGWITVSGASNRTGSGTVNYTVAANSGAARTGTLTVAGQTVTVSQAGPCTFSLSSTSRSFGAAGGSGSTTVTTASGCTWTVTSNSSWLTFSGGSNRTGSRTVNFTAAANSGAARTGTLTIAGIVFTVTQSAGACSFSLSPTSQNIAVGGGSGSTTVTTGSACTWTVTSNNSWITVIGGSSRTGSGTVNFTVAANSGATSRIGSIAIALSSFSITQAAGASVLPAPSNLRFTSGN